MKLLYCPRCGDLVRLTVSTRCCRCGECSGRYLDDINVEIVEGTVLGFDNLSFWTAVQKQNEPANNGHEFTAFVIPPNASSVKRVKRGDNEC